MPNLNNFVLKKYFYSKFLHSLQLDSFIFIGILLMYNLEPIFTDYHLFWIRKSYKSSYPLQQYCLKIKLRFVNGNINPIRTGGGEGWSNPPPLTRFCPLLGNPKTSWIFSTFCFVCTGEVLPPRRALLGHPEQKWFRFLLDQKNSCPRLTNIKF